MPWYMDRHDGNPSEPFSPDDILRAHELDQAVQDKYGVRYLTAMVDVERQCVFCLAEAPSKEAAETVHREAHGMLADRIIEVDPSTVREFFGVMKEIETGELSFGTGLRTILFTDIEGSTALYEKLGDDGALVVRHAHDEIVRDAIRANEGREIKHTGDGIMACFGSVVGAVRAAVQIQTAIAERNAAGAAPFHVRVGLNAGEPVAEGSDLFGTAVNLAARICGAAQPGTIFASHAVRDFAAGKAIQWEEVGPLELRGFDEPVSLYRLVPSG